MDQETKDFLDEKIQGAIDSIRQGGQPEDQRPDALDEYLNRVHGLPVPEESAEGSTTREESGPEQNPLAIQGLTEESLMKFVLAVISVAPQAGIGLKGIELTGAVFEALPGFLKGLNGWWNPSGGI